MRDGEDRGGAGLTIGWAACGLDHPAVAVWGLRQMGLPHQRARESRIYGVLAVLFAAARGGGIGADGRDRGWLGGSG